MVTLRLTYTSTKRLREKRELRIEHRRRIWQQQELERDRGIAQSRSERTIDDVEADIVVAVPKFFSVYLDDGSGGPNAEDAIPEYGATDEDVRGKMHNDLVGSHEWLVYKGEI